MIDLSPWLFPGAPTRDTAFSSMRRPPRHSDEALTGTTRLWLRKLPAGRRPLQLCTLYPRVANRIAWCWPDTALTAQVLDDLLVDRRGGRAGFPRPIVTELRRLRDYNGRPGTTEAHDGPWEALRHFWVKH